MEFFKWGLIFLFLIIILLFEMLILNELRFWPETAAGKFAVILLSLFMPAVIFAVIISVVV